jgi:sortase A
MRRKIRVVLIFILLTIGVGILLYPDLMNEYERRRHVGFIQGYTEYVALMEASEIEDELQRARNHNETITDITVNDPWNEGVNNVKGTAEYYSILNFDPNGMMGRIEIPIINVDLPIFHGSTSEVLDRGVGHLPHTSFPIGGDGNHSILTAHTGLVNARLFTDLVRVTYGDIFVVTVAGTRIAYEVEQIDIVLPYEITHLQIDPDRDFITLVTCTPYGINSHRLLVRGERIAYEYGMVDEIQSTVAPFNARHLAVVLLLLLMLLITIVKGIRRVVKRSKIDEDARFDREYDEVFWDEAKGE